jgi:hypothetical protein
LAVSDVSISNLALQKLGAIRINSLGDDSRNARSCNACYELLRDEEMGAYPWNFAKTRIVLAPSSVTPAFDYTYAFPLPPDCLSVLLPNRTMLDWRIEQHQGSLAILTNEGPSINVVYLAKVIDPMRFDQSFVLGLAYKMAFHMAEEITQSNEKKQEAAQAYKDVIARAKRNNAFQNEPTQSPEDTWLTVQRNGIGSGVVPGSWYSVG